MIKTRIKDKEDGHEFMVTRIMADGDGCGYVVDKFILKDKRVIKMKLWFCIEGGRIIYPIKLDRPRGKLARLGIYEIDVFTWYHVYEVN